MVDFSVSDMPVVIFPDSASDVNLIGIYLRTVFGSYLPIQHCQTTMICNLFEPERISYRGGWVHSQTVSCNLASTNTGHHHLHRDGDLKMRGCLAGDLLLFVNPVELKFRGDQVMIMDGAV